MTFGTERHYDYSPEHPLREALRVTCGGEEPPQFVRGYTVKTLTDEQVMELQDWCSVNCKPEWGTGIGALEAAEHIVEMAVENANIPPDPDEDPTA